MFTCTFFGHRNSPKYLKPILRFVLADLIENENVRVFYVGNNGDFDSMVYDVLSELKLSYHEISYRVVFAYMLKNTKCFRETMLPEGIEAVPKRFAISWRNKWMVENADYVVTYVNRSGGGAAQFRDLAVRKNKIVINLADFPQFVSSPYD